MRTFSTVLLTSCLLASCSPTSDTPSDEVATASETPVAAPANLETLATGANISGANGIHFGPDGQLYITSVIGSDLSIMDPITGDIMKRYGLADGVMGPDDVAFGPDGSYYWTSILTGQVAGVDANGNSVIAAQLPPGPNPITFSDDGRLFVSQCFLGTNVYELDPAGLEPARLIADDLGPGCGLNGMDWGPDNRLYGPRWFVGEVISIDVDTGDRRVEASGFTTPAAIKFDSAGILHVLDTATGDLIRVENGEKTTLATLTPGLDNFAFDADDTPFISSYTDGFIKRLNSDGSVTEMQPGGMSHPGGLAAVDDIIWVADVHAIRGFDRQTGDEVLTQRNIVGVGDMGGTLNLAADGDNLILTSWFDGDVRIWNPKEQRRVAHYSGLSAPVAAIRYAGAIAIAEHGSGSVNLHTEDAVVPLANGLSAPTGLVADDGALYVSDRAKGQILKIAEDGAALEQAEIRVDGLEAPEGFVFTDTGIVVVEAAAARLIHIAPDGTRRELADLPPGSPSLPGLPPSQIFNGVAVDKDGNLFVTGEAERVLYRLKAPW